MADGLLREIERRWLAGDQGAAEPLDVGHVRAGLPGLSPSRRQAGQRACNALRHLLVQKVHRLATDDLVAVELLDVEKIVSAVLSIRNLPLAVATLRSRVFDARMAALVVEAKANGEALDPPTIPSPGHESWADRG